MSEDSVLYKEMMEQIAKYEKLQERAIIDGSGHLAKMYGDIIFETGHYYFELMRAFERNKDDE